MDVYVAFNSVSDYTAPAPSFHSVHMTLDDAIHALYPDRKDFQLQFTQSTRKDTWNGPDGFGMVRKVELQEPPKYIQIKLRLTKEATPNADSLLTSMVDELAGWGEVAEIVDSEVYQLKNETTIVEV